MSKNVDLEKVRSVAEKYYRDGDFYCSEAVVKTIKDEFNLEISDDCIKMASGFPVGIGGKACTCGAVSAGVMMIGLFFGRTKPRDLEGSQKAMQLSAKLYESFTKKHKVACCKILTRGMELGSDVHMQQCIKFTGEIAYETAKIIDENLEFVKY